MRYLMTFSYDGTNYSGYQKQPNANTIQEEIEKVLYKVNGNNTVIIHATGRTDAHVHALSQKAHFDMDTKMSVEDIRRALNSLLPDDIYVKNIEIVSDDFHARYNIVSKEYIYIMNIGEYNPLERNHIYQYNKALDIDKMKEAVQYFIGEHNFKSFTKTDVERDDYVRIIFDATIEREDDYIKILFKGNGFLRYMVRNMVGTLIEVGEGKRESSDIQNILNEESRISAGKTAPPEGLYLKDVFY